MRPISSITVAAAFLAILFSMTLPLPGQGPERSPVAPLSPGREDGLPVPSVAEVEAALAALELDTSIEDSVKLPLRQKYEQALEALESASGFAARAKEYREAIQSGADRVAALRAELQAIESGDGAADLDVSGTAEELQSDLDSRRVSLELLREQLTKVTEESARADRRTVEIPARLLNVQRELSDIRARLASPEFAETEGGLSTTAETMLLRAKETQLSDELGMLEEEQLSQSIRQELLTAQRALLARQVASGEAAVERLSEVVNLRLSNMADRVRRVVDAVPAEVTRQSAGVDAIVHEVRALADELEAVIRDAKQIDLVQNETLLAREGLAAEFSSIQEQLELGSHGEGMVQLLYDLDRRSLNARRELRERPATGIEQPRIASLHVREKLRNQSVLEEQLGTELSGQLEEVVAVRREALEELSRQYAGLTRTMAATGQERQQYLDLVDEVREYVAEKLFGFGLRACPPVTLATVQTLPESMRWGFQVAHWQEVGSGLVAFFTRMPLRTFGTALLITVLIFLRPRMVAALEQTGRRIRRISTDRYRNTAEALLWTFLLAIPVPLAIGYTAWALEPLLKPSDWFLGLQAGLQRAAWIALAAGLMQTVMRRGGLGSSHFGWQEETLDQIRAVIFRTVVVYLPAFVLTLSCTYGDALPYLESLGRVSFLVAHFWMAYQICQLFFSGRGAISRITGGEKSGLLIRWRWAWLTLCFAAPLALIVLMMLGYMITSIILSLGFIVTLTVIAAGIILHGLVLRWFAIKQRRLALNEAVEARRARQDVDDEETPSEIVEVDAEEAVELDLETIAEQTRELLRSIFTLAVLSIVLTFWSTSFPLVDLMGSMTVPFFGGLTLLRLTIAIVIVVVTVIVVKNLPGLLELLVLRSKDTNPGTRVAIYTLCQYAATAVGAALFLNVVQVDWAKFGWVVAALSVGLGFGLQEVVANFVCGLILLFERPIRVGDIVTVESTTGTVTKIHLRATTITNWDRQEFVVPNKTLITSTLLNWTLSAPLNRVVIPVGVAYGSDTNQAREILLSVAAEHPNVLDEPQPMATFEQFADSSLNILLRVYLPDLDARLSTISELHTEIHERFATAGIEIAFPQRDLHLRGGWKEACDHGLPQTGTT